MGAGTFYTLLTFFFAQKQKKTRKKHNFSSEKNKFEVLFLLLLLLGELARAFLRCFSALLRRISWATERRRGEKYKKTHTSSGSDGDGDNIQTRRNTKSLCSAVSRRRCCWLRRNQMCCGELSTTTTSLCECVSHFALLSLRGDQRAGGRERDCVSECEQESALPAAGRAR